jgi:hypothetical protein
LIILWIDFSSKVLLCIERAAINGGFNPLFVEMYQWQESSHTEGEGDNQRTVYTYDKQWVETSVDCSSFNTQEHLGGEVNP